MIEIALTLVIFALCGLLAWQINESRKERKSLMNAIIAKSSEELANLELADKTRIDIKPESDLMSDGMPKDATSISDADDDTFMSVIRGQNGDN